MAGWRDSAARWELAIHSLSGTPLTPPSRGPVTRDQSDTEEASVPFSSDPYEIIWRVGTAEPVVVQTAADADMATAAFHAEMARLQTEGRDGEIVVRHRRDRRQPILRQPLVTSSSTETAGGEPTHECDGGCPIPVPPRRRAAAR